MKNSYRIIITIIVFTLVNTFLFAQTQKPNLLILDKNVVEELRISYQENSGANKKILQQLTNEAEKLLNKKPLSVTDKSIVPPSGDKRDFTSMGPYWWPDPTKKDGLPYIRKDGERNPEYNTITDQEYFPRTVNASQLLTLAYYITGRIKYAEKAAELIHVWFLDEKTRMNPNMKHAQFIPGINTGRGIGLIETREIFRALDAVTLMRTSNVWNKEYDRNYVEWIADYYDWITTHQYGIDESNEKNNHGTWYDVQRISIALFLNRTDAAKRFVEEVKEKRIGSQIEPDGKQPLELARTKSWNYSCMNLSAFFHLALLAEQVEIDLWNYETKNGASIRKALDYLIPFTHDFSKWKYQQLGKFEKENLETLLSIAAKKWKNLNYKEQYEFIYKKKLQISAGQLLF